MTEDEVIAAAAAAFEKRDRIATEMSTIDAEIAGLTRKYSEEMRVWGFTPMLLRRAVSVRLGR